MAPQDIRRKLYDEPFRPFRVFISDGATVDVKNCADAYVSLTEFEVGVDPDEFDVPRRSVYISPNHVTRIDPLAPNAQEPSSNGGR